MDTPQTASNEQERIAQIRIAIRESGDEWRKRMPWLRHTNTIGFGIFMLSISLILLSGWAYLGGHIHALSCIILAALASSLLHELEHDLIHWQYFKNNKAMHHLMMLGVWVFRPGTINPWIRRHLHLLHHKSSGTPADLEERGIGNGMRYSPLRWLVMIDPLVGNLVKIIRGDKQNKARRCLRLIFAYFPFGVLSILAWYTFLIFHLVNLLTPVGTLPGWGPEIIAAMEIINPLVVILIAPHYLRSFCLIMISSSMHYYGNVDSLLKQTQVLNAWYWWPLQLFCFNFGSTHAIHHFVVGEPFYIRQLSARKAHRAMKIHGVPFNDLGTFERANAYPQNEANQA